MSQADRIQRHLERLPPAMLNEVLDFVLFLEQHVAAEQWQREVRAERMIVGRVMQA